MVAIRDAPTILFAYCGVRGMRDMMQCHTLQRGAALPERGASFRERGASYGVLKSAEEGESLAPMNVCVPAM